MSPCYTYVHYAVNFGTYITCTHAHIRFTTDAYALYARDFVPLLRPNAVTPGHALEVCVRRKLSTNLPSCRAAGVECVPMVVEALGGWAPGSISTIRRIGDILGQRVNPLDPSHSTKHLFGRLAITLWRGNAILWLRRAPSLAPSSDGLS